MAIKLRKTGQEVFLIPYSGKDRQHWPKTHERVQRPFLGHEGGNSRNQSEVLFVRKDHLLFS